MCSYKPASAIASTPVPTKRRGEHVDGADPVRGPAADGARDHGERCEAGGAGAGIGLAQVVHVDEQLRQVEEHRHEPPEGHEVEEGQRPCAAAAACRGRRRGSESTDPGLALRRARRIRRPSARRRRPWRRPRPAAIQKGVSRLVASAIRGAVSAREDGAAHADPVDPEREPLRPAGYQLLTKGMPTANEAPAKPSKKPKTSTAPHESLKSASPIERQRRERHQAR